MKRLVLLMLLALSVSGMTGCSGAGIPVADKELIGEIDSRADALKTEILNSPNLEADGAEVYYVSPNGDNTQDGKTPETAWQTLKKLNRTQFKPGTVVKFERGGIWRGQLEAKAGVTYTAYGEGDKPKLYGSPENGAVAEKWELYYEKNGAKIWKYTTEMVDIGTLVFDDGEKGVAYKEIPSYFEGKPTVRGTYGKAPFVIEKELDNDLEMVSLADSIMTDGGNPDVSNKLNRGFVYLRCDKGNPAEVFKSIEFLPRGNGIQVQGDGVTINNMCIKYVGSHGIGTGTRKNLTVTDCEIGYIGGSIQNYSGEIDKHVTRFGNGVEIYGGCDNYNVSHNYVYECYDAGITHQFKNAASSGNPVKMNNVTYANNLIENCIYSIEYFLEQTNGDGTHMMSNIVISGNIMRNAGYGWGSQRPDGGELWGMHIMGWDHENKAENFVIENNIFDRYDLYAILNGTIDEKYLPEYKNNTFIAEKGKPFGRYGIRPTKDIPYTADTFKQDRFKNNEFYVSK